MSSTQKSTTSDNYACPCGTPTKTLKLQCVCCGYTNCISCSEEILAYCKKCDSWVCSDMEASTKESRESCGIPGIAEMFTAER